MTGRNTPSFFPFGKEQLLPAEEMLEVGRKREKLIIGIPSEVEKVETRVPLTPQAVDLLVKNDHEVIIESNAGMQSNYSDREYSEAGAIITKNRKDVFHADIILKISPFDIEEVELLKGNQILISALHFNTEFEESLRMLMQKKVCAIAYSYIRDENGFFPIEQILSEISGSNAVLIASEYLSTVHNGKGVILGGVTGISPTEVVILGSDTAAEFAARAALGLGATIKVFDDSINNLRNLENRLHQRIFTSVFQPQVLMKALQSADVVIGALNACNSTKFIVPDDFIQKMKEGSVIVDLCMSKGGCFETSIATTLKRPVYRKHGVVHYCVPNITARVARTSSIALSNTFAPILINIGEIGGIHRYVRATKGFRNGIYVYNGILTNADLGARYNIPHQDIDLMMTAF
ncbi:MAG: alanine dehydrogenase [Bacteroidota bacterium]|nr:alanine dehydrogenase [Bacteroidota bacterium]MDP4204876.1 alanine dehydrogenase [Bacteroidota bacterium]